MRIFACLVLVLACSCASQVRRTSDYVGGVRVGSTSGAENEGHEFRPPLESRPVRDRVRSRRLTLTGAMLTGFGLSSTFVGILMTPFESLEGPFPYGTEIPSVWSWRNGLAIGLGSPTLLIGVILWAVGMM